MENKIIDFSYFLEQKIITAKEYSELLRNFTDNLRIINGRLLLYSKSYYEELHKKTGLLAEIQEHIDKTSAAFHLDVVNKFATSGTIGELIDFTSEYEMLQSLQFKGELQIIRLPNLFTEYANKYFKAQQRFLKNIYEFRQYFNSPVGFGDLKLQKTTINLESTNGPDNGKEYEVSFSLNK